MALEPKPGNGTCWKCGSTLTPLDYGRQDTCRKCGLDTKVCKNCVHWDRSCENECRESQAEPVLEKERANFCDFFSPRSGGSGDGTSSRDAMRAAAEALFRKK